MNKHILLVMRWLKDKDSVSEEELAKNRHHLCGTTANAPYAAVTAATYGNHAAATCWVDEYFLLYPVKTETSTRRN